MTPIEQSKEALQEVSDTMDRKGGVAPIIRMDTLKKVNAALALLKTMEGEPVAWMEPASKFTMNADMKKALSSGHIKETCEADRFSIPLYASTHTKTITVDEVETLIRLLERSKVGTKFAREYEKKCQPDQEARTGIDFDKDVDAMLFLLRDRLTSKFK